TSASRPGPARSSAARRTTLRLQWCGISFHALRFELRRVGGLEPAVILHDDPRAEGDLAVIGPGLQDLARPGRLFTRQQLDVGGRQRFLGDADLAAVAEQFDFAAGLDAAALPGDQGGQAAVLA